jgi:hypothetical protein
MTVANPRPAPLVPAEVDLRDFAFMPLEGDRLRKSSTWLRAATDPWVAYACMNLWIEAWHQVPAGSLPGSRVAIGRMSGSTPKVWNRIADRVLEGWVGPCTDGRYYHPVVCAKAMEAWERKTKQRKRTKAATEAAARKRARDRNGQDEGDRNGQRNGPSSASVTVSKGQRQWTETVREKKIPSPLRGEGQEPSSLTDDEKQESVTVETEAYRRGKEVLGSTAAALIKKLVNAKAGDYAAALEVIEAASKKENPREYIGGVIRAREKEQERANPYGKNYGDPAL